MHEAVFKDCFGHHRRAIRHGHQRHRLGLKIGGEAWERLRHHIDPDQRCRSSGNADTARFRRDRYPGFAQLIDEDRQMLDMGIAQQNIAAGDRRRNRIGARFDPVGNDLVLGGVQPLNALDAHGIGAEALDLGAHRNQAVAEIDHFRLARHIHKLGFALGQRRRH